MLSWMTSADFADYGPNMGGKSTYLRTVALVSILASKQVVLFQKKARLGLIDRIFTRVGASDDLRRGRSTFMMEMIEVAHILRRIIEITSPAR